MSRILEIQNRKIADDLKEQLRECSETAVAFGYQYCLNETLTFVDECIARSQTNIAIPDLLKFFREMGTARQKAKELLKEKI